MGDYYVKKHRICFVTVVQIIHVLVEELEHGRTIDVVVGTQVDECSVFVIEGDTELNGETPDDVGVEIWGQHCL